MKPDERIGQRIKIYRKKAELRQRHMSQMLGVSPPVYSKIETGATDVRLSLLCKIADVFQVTIEELLEGQSTSSSYVTPDAQIKELNHKLESAEREIIDLRSTLIRLYEITNRLDRGTIGTKK